MYKYEGVLQNVDMNEPFCYGHSNSEVFYAIFFFKNRSKNPSTAFGRKEDRSPQEWTKIQTSFKPKNKQNPMDLKE